MSARDREKTCFVISPIGSQGDPIRLRSDQVLRHIIEPVVSNLGYEEPIRADHIAEPGMITHQIIQHLLEDDLVVADLTGPNPNVFYELAIRHAIRGSIVLLIAEGENPPFDVSQSRAIKFDFRDLDSVANCKTELARQIRHLEERPNDVFSPVSTAVDLRAMQQSGDPAANRDAQIISMMQTLQADMARLEARMDAQTRVNVRSGGRLLEERASAILEYNEARRAQKETVREAAQRLTDIAEAQRDAEEDVRESHRRVAEAQLEAQEERRLAREQTREAMDTQPPEVDEES